ncbi:hypothetical protein FRC07_002786 [Ceratobasidium sp. 392]|nr:hypothetical protein FRC07_002786 [Ceratobasidium sp. 392]
MSAGVNVDWRVEGGGWKTVPKEIADVIHISRYNLYQSDGLIYKYTLEFTNTVNHNFRFTDQSPDIYFIFTIREGDHSVSYNSDAPNIKHVKAS